MLLTVEVVAATVSFSAIAETRSSDTKCKDLCYGQRVARGGG